MVNRTWRVVCLASLLQLVIACSAPSAPSILDKPSGGGFPIVVMPDEGNATQGAPATKPSLAQQLAAVDEQLANAPTGNLAYNRPSSMQMEQTVELQLLLSPVASKQELQQSIKEPGQVVSATINITPRMKAELFGLDPGAFTITPRHASSEQLLSIIEPTEWLWKVTANKEGTQKLNLTVYRLVEFEGKEYWRVLREYEDVIQIDVTLGQRLAKFDWYWLAGIVLTGLALPAFFLWLQRRRKV